MQVSSTCLTKLLVMLMAGWLWAGTTGKISGTITDAGSGEPLIGANITLANTTLGAATDVDGSYFILNIPPGRYTLVVEYLGYHAKTVEGIGVSVDLTTRQDVGLSSDAVAFDGEIVVTANRDVLQKDLTSSESRVSAEKIDALPVNNVSEVLQIQPGVTRGADGAFHIRGGRSSEVAYWVNGVSITDGYDNSQGITVENEAIQELQVISGTFNAEYGNAMSGIINIVTKEGGSQYHGSIKGWTGDYLANNDNQFFGVGDHSVVDTRNVQATLDGPVPGSGDKLRFFATGRYSYNDGYLYGAVLNEQRLSELDPALFENQEDITDFINSDAFTGLFDPVAMNWNEKYTAQGKLTWQAANTLKFDFTGSISLEEYQDYNHDYRFLPEADVNKFNDAYNVNFIANHTLNNSTFYTVNLTYLNREFNEYTFEDPLDSRYQGIPIRGSGGENVGFISSGENLHRFNRITDQYIGKIDLTSQVHPVHLLKLGVEARYTELFQDDYNLIDPANGFFIPDETAPGRDIFTADPIQFSGYVQDKIEFDSFIMNLGMRFDYFDSRGQVLADPRDPDIIRPTLPAHIAMTLEERQAIWYKAAEPKVQVSPRIGLAYPISAKGVIHFSFGHFLQIPELRQLFQRAQYKLAETGNPGAPYGNPDLSAQSTVMYEIGLQQELGSDLKIDVTAFYRDIRDWVTSSPLTDTYRAGSRYSQFINEDYANVRGVTLALNKRLSNSFGYDLVYQFQVAEGVNSNADAEFFRQNSGFEPTIQLSPLSWDQTHNVSGLFYYSKQTWGASAIGRLNTGLPYTPDPDFDLESIGPGATSDIADNSRRKPINYVFDAQAHYIVNYSGLDIRLFAKVFNLFDRRNEVNVFTDTGRAGFTLRTTPGVPAFFYLRPDYYDPPRELQVGLEFEF